MAAAAHTPGRYDGVPQSVGREFNQADKGTNVRKRSKKKQPHKDGLAKRAKDEGWGKGML
jgi:hypothetical protein